jgi:trimeric autotransporter adhesin
MASSYVNDLRLNEMATGDASGTWGDTTNTNLELIAEAFSYGTEAITTNADTHTTTIADGATDPGRSLYLKYTGTLDSACTITIGPNTVSKVWIIENGTSGSQDIILSQGSGANITIPAGDTKVVYSDGAGAGAAFVDAFASLSVVDLKVQDDLTVTDDASVGGDLTITGASTAATYNGIASKTFGTSSIMIGDTTTGTISAADYNTGVGVNVFEDLTSGDNNSAFGFNALTNITTGGNNTAIGRTAMVSTTTQSDNTAVGYAALNVNAAANNTAVGSSALAANTSGAGNTAVGHLALTANTTGADNVAIGRSSMAAATTADQTISIGHIAGAALTTGDYNTFIGGGAGTATTTASSNVAIGNGSFYGNTTGANNTAVGTNSLGANTTASNNTAVGYAALTANTEGSENTAVGFAALDANTTGTNNVAMGYAALGANTSGVRNVAIGAFNGALSSNTTANDNTAIGADALKANTTGTANVAIGTYTLDANTTANNNIAVGVEALSANTTGANNTAMGGQALISNTTADNNTAVGFQALDANTTAPRNTAVGYGSLGGVTTGEENVGVGYLAGNYSIPLTTGAGNTFVGAYLSAAAGASNNQLCLGWAITSYATSWISMGFSTSRTRVAAGSTNWAGDSDERLKENIQTSSAGLSFINDLRPVTFDWKKKGEVDSSLASYKEGSDIRVRETDSLNKHGFIAQEVKTALDNHSEVLGGSEIWQEDSVDGTQGLSLVALVPMLVKAIQELSAQNAELTTRITALEG